jgi:hypothetical protein
MTSHFSNRRIRIAEGHRSWAVRTAEQDSSGDQLSPKGDLAMVKKLQLVGSKTALVVLGWVALFFGFLVDPMTAVVLQTIARVLPMAGDIPRQEIRAAVELSGYTLLPSTKASR